ncbi:hypothetical protein Efla_005814 [Eimeria flavescens]
MRALLLRQKKKYESAYAVGSSLRERKLRQDEQNQAGVMRFRWSKAYGQLKKRERTISYELRQLMSSELSDCFKDIAATASLLSERTASEILFAEPFGAENQRNKGTKPNCTESSFALEQSARAGVGSVCFTESTRPWLDRGETQHQVEEETRDSPTSVSASTLTHLKAPVRGPLSTSQPVKEWIEGIPNGPSTLPSSRSRVDMYSKRAAAGETISSRSSNEQWTNQTSGCVFQWAAVALKEEDQKLERAYGAATADVAAAFAAVEGECTHSHLLASTSAHFRNPGLPAHSRTQDLSDTEDAILRGDAPQVLAAAEAASQLALASRHEAPLPPEAHQQLESHHLGERKGMSPSWEAVLAEYSKTLLTLETTHTRQMEQYQQQIRQHRSTLRLAVAELLEEPQEALQRRPKGVRAQASTRSASQLDEKSSSAKLNSTASQNIAVYAVDEGVLHEDKSGVSSQSYPPNQQLATLHEFDDCGQQHSEEHKSRDTGPARVDAALSTVRWLTARICIEEGGAGCIESLPQRLQVAFPFAGLGAISRVVKIQHQLNLITQKTLTCRREWQRERRAALADVEKKLEEIASCQRERAEKHRALVALKSRQKLLQAKLSLHKRLVEQQKSSQAALLNEQAAAQLQRAIREAEREKERRRREKELLDKFRQKKLLEDQQQHEQAMRQEDAAREPERIRLLKAARVARRQEQHKLRALEQQLERQGCQLQEEMLRNRLIFAAEKLKPLAVRDPFRVHQQTVASHSHAEAGAQQRELKQKQLQHRLGSFEVMHSYSVVQLMQDIRFRLSAALAESQLSGSKAAHELLLKMSSRAKNHESPFE